MSASLTPWQLEVLRVVRLGEGNWDARRIDLTVDYRVGPGPSPMLAELEELAGLGYLVRYDSRGGMSGRWSVTETGLHLIEEADASG